MKLFVLIITLTLFQNISGQEKISIIPPNDWTEFQRNEVMNSIYNKLDFSEKIIKQIEETGSKSIQLLGYYANDFKGDYRPNIQIILRLGLYENFEQFKSDIDLSLEEFSKIINGFSVVDQPSIIKVKGKDAVFMKFKGYYLTKTNEELHFETILIAIPFENNFYQITLNQSIEDNFDEEFSKIIDSIKFD